MSRLKGQRRSELPKISPSPEFPYPLFCFKYLQEVSFPGCKDVQFFTKLLTRLQKLSELGWKQIRTSQRHGFGMEKIPINKIKPCLSNSLITDEVTELHVFRATGNNHVFVGLQEKHIFHIIFIETTFGDIYDHS